MSDKKQKRQHRPQRPQKAEKPARPKKDPAQDRRNLPPVEVLVHNITKGFPVVAEYRHEAKWWYGTRLYKVYHPTFTETQTEGVEGYRWVMSLGKVLGNFDPNDKPSWMDEVPPNFIRKDVQLALNTLKE